MNMPNEDGVASRRAAANKRSLQEAIMRQISKRAQSTHAFNSRRNRKMEGNKPTMRNRTHNKLIGYIINEYMVKGEIALPMVDDMADPEESDEEYYYKVIKGIQSKPPEYESLMPLSEQQMSYHRAMRIKVHTPVATPMKVQPTPDSDDEFPLVSIEKSLDQLPCTEKMQAEEEISVEITPKKKYHGAKAIRHG